MPADTSIEQSLPHDREAERSILGAVLLDNTAFSVANEKVRWSDFFLRQHQVVFQGMVRLSDAGKPIDITLLMEDLRRHGEMLDTVDIAYLSGIADGLPRATNVAHYCRSVREKAILRSLIHAAAAIQEQALAAHEDADVILDRAAAIMEPFVPTRSEDTSPKIDDLPSAALSGRLGEICETHLRRFPRSYSFPALVTAASVLVEPDLESGWRANLFTGLVGPVHSGKSAAIAHAQSGLGLPADRVMKKLFGSAEGMLEQIGKRSMPVVVMPDELSHLLQKAAIKNASFAYVLPTIFYDDAVDATVGGRRPIEFSARVSLLGGVVDENVADHFGAGGLGGLWDRFFFGRCPTDFRYHHAARPAVGAFNIPSTLRQPRVNGDVDEWKRELIESQPNLNSRVIEICIRVALVCAAVDGCHELRARSLAPTLNLVMYQHREREFLKPNPGETKAAILENNLLKVLESNPGKWFAVRDLKKKVHAERYGALVWNATVEALFRRGDLERQECGRKRTELRVIR